MEKVLAVFQFGSRDLSDEREKKEHAGFGRSRVLYLGNSKRKQTQRHPKGMTKISLTVFIMLIFGIVLISGAFYLFQVNAMATRGYEIRDIENKIKDLKKQNDSLMIKEVELKSMYNIEKNSQDLEMTRPKDITYLEIESPVAMK
jgi:cell division protein FtsL